MIVTHYKINYVSVVKYEKLEEVMSIMSFVL